MKKIWFFWLGLALLGIVSVQFAMIGSLRTELSVVRSEMAGIAEAPRDEARVAAPRTPQLRPVPVRASSDVESRLENLEGVMADLAEAMKYLRERGRLPLNTGNLEDYKAQFADPNASDRDRLRALGMLRRNRQFSEDQHPAALNWLQTTTNAGTRRQIVQSLDGSTNAILKQPLLSLLASESSSQVREELADTLSGFTDDPAVEQKLWDLAQNDPDREVREEAMEALAEGRLSPTRVATLQERAMSADAPLEDRLTAFRALREAEADSPEVLAGMVQMAHGTEDPVARARIFSAFDGVDDPSLMAPLVSGLQDPNPVVREEAADALSNFARDPQIQEWLAYVSQNDSDPRVQREAHRALERARRQDGRGGRR